MAEKGQTSSITSVTEEEMSAGSESDTTESSYSNITSSVLSSTDTDDKLTPGLISISISNIKDGAEKSSKSRRIRQVEAEKAQDEFENTVHKQSEAGVKNHGEGISQNDSFQAGITMPAIKFPYGSNPLPLKYARGNGETKWKGGSVNHPGFHHQTPSFVKPNLETFTLNGGVDDKYSTDFSETSSVQASSDRNNNNELDEEDTDGVNEGMCSESQKPTFLPDLFSSTWYQAPCFNRYWSHYRFVMEWYHLHVQAVKTLQAQMFNGWGYPQPGKYTHRSQQANGGKARRSRHSRRARQKRRRQSESSSFSAKGQNQVLQAGAGHNPSLHSKTVSKIGSDDEELEMEITDDMLEFFTTSYKHKIERDKEEEDPISSAPTERPGVRRTEEMKELYGIGAPMIQGMETAMQMTFDRFLDRFQPNKEEEDPISSAPTERPGVRRTEEMKELYGIGAPMIQGMETAMQMTFDRFLDRFQPSLWPNMPLKINFA